MHKVLFYASNPGNSSCIHRILSGILRFVSNNEVLFQNTIGLRAWTAKGGMRMRVAHRHQDLEFNYLLSGTMQYLIGGAFVTLPQRQLCVIWGAMPHQSISSDPARHMMLVTLPLAQAMCWNLPQEFLRRLLGRGVVVDPQTNPGEVYQLAQWQHDLKTDQQARRQLVLDEIAARLQRMALNIIEESDEMPLHAFPETLSNEALLLTGKMAELISRRFQEPLSINEIAAHVNLHPNYAMTLFRQQSGMTLNSYLTRQRVAHAQRLLAITAMPILQIAEAAGFHSVSRFYEAFKEETGCTPRQFRQRLTQASY